MGFLPDWLQALADSCPDDAKRMLENTMHKNQVDATRKWRDIQGKRKMNIMIVNNSGNDLSMFRKHFVAAADTGALPEEIADLFSIDVVIVDGQTRVIVDMADD